MTGKTCDIMNTDTQVKIFLLIFVKIHFNFTITSISSKKWVFHFLLCGATHRRQANTLICTFFLKTVKLSLKHIKRKTKKQPNKKQP